MDLLKKIEKPSGEFLYLSFAVTRLKIYKKYKKNDIEIAQNSLPSSRKPPGGISSLQLKVPLEPIKHRLQNRNWSCEKKR